MSYISHDARRNSLATEVDRISCRIKAVGDLPHVSTSRQLELLEQLWRRAVHAVKAQRHAGGRAAVHRVEHVGREFSHRNILVGWRGVGPAGTDKMACMTR